MAPTRQMGLDFELKQFYINLAKVNKTGINAYTKINYCPDLKLVAESRAALAQFPQMALFRKL